MTTRRWLLLLILCGIAIRVGLWACYEPVVYPDTQSYLDAARDLVEGGLSRSEGRRTPGYPLLVALAGVTPQGIWLLQAVMGITISALLFYIAFILTRSAGFSFAVGMTYNLNLAQLFFEAALLSEPATTFSVIAVAAALVDVIDRVRAGRPAAMMLLVLGVLSGFALLVRAQFVFLPPLIALVLANASWRSGLRPATAVRNITLTLAPAVVMVVAWGLAVQASTGFFTLSSQYGIGFANHSVHYVESASDRYAAIRDILLKQRESDLKTKGHARGTVWDSVRELESSTGMTRAQLSRELQSMSLELFARNPGRYAKGVAEAWVSFWLVPNYWRLELLTPPALRPALEAIWWVEHKVLRLANAGFIILIIAVAASAKARRLTKWDLSLTSISAIILGSSIVQALAEYGENTRYGVTIQALVLLVVLVAAFRVRDSSMSYRDPIR